MTILVKNASAATESNIDTWSGGRGTIAVAGTLGSATVQLMAVNAIDNANGMPFVPVGDAIDSEGFVQFDLGEVLFKVVVTGTPTNLYVSINGQTEV